ncbi:FtsX-like permease family protein [Patulibacter minatonensis]|uniref:FtsX-like permease family protein n=1 Tax=Patulibacter minatonensis TaxID=298163 RepID=UPI000479F13A|nr:FtsX-like permease family protein [Patulibacter minatonensis]
MSTGSWLRELGLGARLAAAGGRASWSRTVMTAVGVGLGVALLLLAASAPNALDGRDDRNAARSEFQLGAPERRASADTALVASADTNFRDGNVRARLVRAEGPDAPVPPGVSRLPGPGEVVVSPRLRDLLASSDGALLRPRVPGRIVGTIADTGLAGPRELAYYAGDATLRPGPAVQRIDHFGSGDQREGLPPALALLVVIAVVVMLLPVAVFVAAAVRFGGEERDRRLAALSLVGADRRMVRRIAAGEALLGALLGLALGGALFLGARQLARSVEIDGLSVFPSDLRPATALVVLVALAVPVVAVVVTQLALGRVAIDPLGVVRRGTERRRRVWWRLLLPVAGLALLFPLLGVDVGGGESVDPAQVSVGVTLLLLGVTAILPWLVETVVHRLGGGGVSWQLAVRRLQADSGTSARVVSAIAVAVAGAIALQMLFSSVEDRSSTATGKDVERVQAQVLLPSGPGGPDRARVAAALRSADGVRPGLVVSTVFVATRGEDTSTVTVAPCATLRRLVRTGPCRDGSVFLARGDDAAPRAGSVVRDASAPGEEGSAGARWRVPADARRVASRVAPDGSEAGGILATPGAVGDALPGLAVRADVRLDRSADAAERLRNVAAGLGPLTRVDELQVVKQDRKFVAIRRGIVVAAVLVLLMIGASMLVAALEQLHARRRLLASLVAFGTPPATISRSILLQTAVPVVLGLALAVVAGIGLGAVLLRLVDAPLHVDAGPLLVITGVGAAVVPLVTALSTPALRRILRPGGLRTE